MFPNKIQCTVMGGKCKHPLLTLLKIIEFGRKSYGYQTIGIKATFK